MFKLFSRAINKAMRKARAANLRAATAAIKKMAAAGAKPVRKKRTAAKPAAPKPAARAVAKPREGLGAAVRRIKAAAPARAAPTMRVARGASFEALRHAGKHGARSYRLYIPASLRAAVQPTAPAPLVVMLHGCSQTPEQFATGTRMNVLAEEFGFLVAYPEQPSTANANRCWNWFRLADQTRGAGEPALIAGVTRAVLRAQQVDPARVYVAGLSAGGAAALIAATAYPDLFAAVGVHSGLPVGAAYSAAQAMLAMRRGSTGAAHGVAIPTIVFHGDADRVVHPRNGRVVAIRSAAATPGLTTSQTRGRSAGGRGFTRTLYSTGDDKPVCEHWSVEGAGHAWAGGDAAGGYADPSGPDASREMLRFFLDHRKQRARRSLATAAPR